MAEARMAEPGMAEAGIEKAGIFDSQQKFVMLFLSQLTVRRGRGRRHPVDEKLVGN
jgi:hypothetical protein